MGGVARIPRAMPITKIAGFEQGVERADFMIRVLGGGRSTKMFAD
jgi:hypothetical protein